MEDPQSNVPPTGNTASAKTPAGAFEAAVAKLRIWKEAAGFGAIIFAAVLGVAALGWVYMSGPGWEERSGFLRRPRATAEQPAAPQQPTVRRALDGVLVPEGTAQPDYFAVMIDNIAEALPQSGVAGAPLVYEAPVEGGITRLMAVYPSDASFEQLGPVRSARPYYVDWADELGALYVHVGGSPEALEKLRASDVRDLNEFFAGRFFWRDGKRRAPHNAYVSSEKLADALKSRARTAAALATWKFKDDAAPEDRPKESRTTSVGEVGKWKVGWRYDSAGNSYARIIATGAQKDSDGTPVLAKNVLIQFTEVLVLDEVGRRRVDTKSGGEAVILRDGVSVGGTWKFDTASGRTRFYDAAGNELSLNAGVTWVEVVPDGTPVSN